MEKQAKINHVLGLPGNAGSFVGPFGPSTDTQSVLRWGIAPVQGFTPPEPGRP